MKKPEVVRMNQQFMEWHNTLPSIRDNCPLPGPLTTEFTYRKVGDAALQMKIWYPSGWKDGRKKFPSIVFFAVEDGTRVTFLL